MAEYTVKFLIETLKNGYDPDEIIVATWWTKADVAQVIEDEGYGSDLMSGDEFVEDVWVGVSSNVDVALDYAEEQVNSEISGFVESYVMRGEK